MSKTLIIVESPAKCKKIEEFLGPGYKVMASYGHLRTINNLKDIDLNNFNVKYSMIDDKIKAQQVEKLRREINISNEIILATDNDREGESISWHLATIFDLPIESTKRIIFNEITEKAIKSAINNPSKINMSLVESQQTRQIIDMLVGFSVTPILWETFSKKHKNSLSAGRCQTPALKLVYDNHIEIKNSPGTKVYEIFGYFTNMNLRFELNKDFANEKETYDFLENTLNHDHIYNVDKPKISIKQSPQPLTTSLLQQQASNDLHISPKETMKLAQELYENGLITYMRTDSQKYSKEFIESAKRYIVQTYNDDKYVKKDIDKYENTINADANTQTKNKKQNNLAQEAHEAIRPVNINFRSDNFKDIKIKISNKAEKLYQLIWTRTLESCVSNATYTTIKATIDAYDNTKFEYQAEEIVFAGWKVVNNKETKTQTPSIYQYLLNMKKGCKIDYKKIEAIVKLKDTKSHMTEARLVQLLEEKGIGRPSTFCSLVDKIQERGYVEKKNIDGNKIECVEFILVEDVLEEKIITKEFGNEKNKLVITQLGILIIEYLLDNFADIFNYEYTKDMENQLDMISQTKLNKYDICTACYNMVSDKIKELKGNKGEIEKKEIKIDDCHTYIIGKYGPVIKYQDPNDKTKIFFKNIRKDFDISKLNGNSPINLEDLLDESNDKHKILGKYRDETLYLKNGKYGCYIEWGTNKVGIKELDIPMDKIKYEDVIMFLEKDNLLDPSKPIGLLREIDKNTSIRNGKYGNYIFYKTSRMKKPKFFKFDNTFKHDYMKCNKELILTWLKNTHGI